LFPVHANASDFVQRTIRQVIKGLIKSIGPQSPKLLNIIRNFPPGGDRLVIRILVVLTDTGRCCFELVVMRSAWFGCVEEYGVFVRLLFYSIDCFPSSFVAVRPSPELVKTVKAVFVERDLDAKFLIPIISGLTKDEIKQYLPRIVALLDGTPMQNQVVKRVFSRITTGVGNTSPPISSQDLLMALHDMEGIPPQKVVEAINVCFNMSEAFKSEIIAVVLQQLIDQPKIPGLSMMTVSQYASIDRRFIHHINIY
ncbi:Symplekin tight junction protein C terminal-domain-containing protein, partial [Jimgerdemannia flammicorona]